MYFCGEVVSGFFSYDRNWNLSIWSVPGMPTHSLIYLTTAWEGRSCDSYPDFMHETNDPV